MSKPIFNLVVELPGAAARYYQLSAKAVCIGRGDGNAIIIEEDAVSSRHCEIRQREGAVSLIDLRSTNGTRLNGEALGTEARELHDGDVIFLGLTAKARFVRVVEIRDKAENISPTPGSLTKKLERQTATGPAINPVAAAVAKAARDRAKIG